MNSRQAKLGVKTNQIFALHENRNVPHLSFIRLHKSRGKMYRDNCLHEKGISYNIAVLNFDSITLTF